MSDSNDIRALAIDGGGTRSRFACRAGGQRFEIERGPANAFSDFDGTVASLTEGLQAMSVKSGLSLDQLCTFPAFVGLAGVIDPTIAGRLQAALPLQNAEYADDRRAALRGAFGVGEGVLAHCGTGSFFASHIAGTTRLAGGWGYDLGDEASAQWVGRRALSLTLEWIDGFREDSDLYKDISGELRGAVGVLRFVAQATPRDYGTFAPKVTELAQQGDAAAEGILRQGATYVSDGLEQMGWRPGRAISLTGGIAAQYATYLPSDKQADLTAPLGPPLEGALALACERNKERSHGDR